MQTQEKGTEKTKIKNLIKVKESITDKRQKLNIVWAEHKLT